MTAGPATRPSAAEVGELASVFYALPGNVVGGSLHIVLDDLNIADEHLDFCVQYAKERNDLAGYVLGRLLLLLSRTQRHKVGSSGPGHTDYDTATFEQWWELAQPLVDRWLS